MRPTVVAILGLALAVWPASAGVQLILSDGQVLEGTDVRREGDAYMLTLAGGGVVPIPDALVDRVALSGDESEATDEVWPPTGLTDSKPEQLAGDPVRPATPSEQTRVLGAPSKFQKGVTDPNWQPSSDWDDDPGDPTRNDFAPSTWTKSIIDPEWVPTNAYPEDHTNFAPSKFQKSVINPTWVPQDGFKQN